MTKFGAIAKKIGMSQVISDDGVVTPVTYIRVLEGEIVQLKNEEKDGYTSVVVGYSPKKKSTKTQKFEIVKEFRLPAEDMAGLKVGDKLTIDQFDDVKRVKVTSVSKGKGFQGVMKKYNFGGGRKTHGSTFHRAPGSIGACAKPGKVHKGKKMPGQMGSEQVTIKKNIVVLEKDENLVAINGPIPGANNTIVTIKTI